MCRRLDWVVMSQLGEDKLLSLLMEIYSDIRQIKYDLQSLLTLLKQQQQKSTPQPPLIATTRTPLKARSQARLKTSFAICERREATMTRGNKRAVAKSVTRPSGWPPAGAGLRGATQDRFRRACENSRRRSTGDRCHAETAVSPSKLLRPLRASNTGVSAQSLSS